MNYISCIIQILEIPTASQSYINSIDMVQFRVQLPCLRSKSNNPIIVNSTIWGDLAYDIANYYKVNDYALVEGYISTSFNIQVKKQIITINITKLYPFLFSLKSNNIN